MTPTSLTVSGGVRGEFFVRALSESDKAQRAARRRVVLVSAIVALAFMRWSVELPLESDRQLDESAYSLAKNTSSGNLERQLKFLGFAAWSGWGLLRGRRKFRAHPRPLLVGLMVLTLLWAGSSSLWSIDPALTFRR